MLVSGAAWFSGNRETERGFPTDSPSGLMRRYPAAARSRHRAALDGAPKSLRIARAAG